MPDRRPPLDNFLPLRPVEFDVLLALGDGERHGYAIMQEARRRSDGQVQLEPGTLYRALRRMREAGLVTETTGRGPDGGDERRRTYRLTALGRRVAAAEAQRMAGLVMAARARGLLGKA
ncbi:MAG TPA: PadR family transcriptional regulator [Vicinamibacteria bacterium]|nr:PadR family transcriptional regulator [Vicinamibacteria bacterium]